MQVAVISDIHANFEALKSLADVLENCDRVLCLGDITGYYCQVNEVVEYLRAINALCLLGNHDCFLINGFNKEFTSAVHFGVDYAKRVITKENLNWLRSLPLIWGGQIGRRSFLLSHGSPFDPVDDYLYPNNPVLQNLRMFNFDVVAFGQTHRRLQSLDFRPYLINPGSVGQSRDITARACALLINTESMNIQTVERTFDASTVINIARENGAEDWISKHLL